MKAGKKTTRAWISKQYATDANLMKRIRIHGYGINKTGWQDWLFGQYRIKPDMQILEIGCGNALFWIPRIDLLPGSTSLCLSDISGGMIRRAKKNLGSSAGRSAFKIFDADKIPFPDGAFDMVIANHMLYHVRNLPKTLGEIRRVLKKGGRLYCTTIGPGHMKELTGWIRRFHLKTNLSGGGMARNFGLDNGKFHLRKRFRNIRRIIRKDRLEIPSIKPILDYISSAGKSEPASRIEAFKAHLRKILKEKKTIRVSKEEGLFIAET